MISKQLALLGLFVILPLILATPVTVGDNQSWDVEAFTGTVDLGTVYTDEIITASFSYIGQNTQDIEGQLVLTDGTIIGPVTCNTNPCELVFDPIPAETEAILQLDTDNESGGFISAYIASLVVTGDATERAGSEIIEQTLAIGDYRFHRIYVPAETDVEVTVFHQAEVDAVESDQEVFVKDAEFIILVSEDGVESATYSTDSQLAATITDIDGASVLFTFEDVPEGFHWIVINEDYQDDGEGDDDNDDLDPEGNTFENNWTFRITYQTERYECPFDTENFPDLTGIFQGCIVASSTNQLPCISFSEVTLQCEECFTGYFLDDGACFVNPCPEGQYRRYGQCLDNPEGCAVFDTFTSCTQCVDETYSLEDGVCQRIPLECPDRTYYDEEDYVCAPVSERCDEYNETNGQCITCINPADAVDEEGECVQTTDLGCTDRQYIMNGECIDIEAVCFAFERIGGKCTQCIFGYEFNEEEECEQIECPDRFVPDDFGNCKRVSDLCLEYDERGACLKCIPSHGPSANGTCLQYERPSPCPARQYLGFDNQCHQINETCLRVNAVGGICTECIEGYYLLYTGECVLQVACAARQFIINNQCYDVSPTCGNFDPDTGKCLNCISEEYELYFGLCIETESCGAREWTDVDDNCHPVDEDCDTFNPSNGLCTSCIGNLNFFNGVCCEPGQQAQDGVCVTVGSAQEINNSNGCTVQFASLGCLRCATGFDLQYDEDGYGICVPQ